MTDYNIGTGLVGVLLKYPFRRYPQFVQVWKDALLKVYCVVVYKMYKIYLYQNLRKFPPFSLNIIIIAHGEVVQEHIHQLEVSN